MSTAGRILITGASGQLGTALRAQPWAPGTRLLAPSHAELDLTDRAATLAWLDAETPDLIVNAAGHVAVDRAESEPEAAMALNAEAPATLAAWAGAQGKPLIHLSTDYVFGGQGDGFFAEDDPTAPINVYGRSKLAGEKAVLAAAPRAAIVRTAWLVSPFGGNFAKTMLRLGAQRSELTVVCDQHGSPTSAIDLAAALRVMAERMLADPAHATGRFHFVNAGEASWHELASFLFERAAVLGGPAPLVRPVPASDYPTPARRPANSRLSTARITREFGITPRPWREAVGEMVEDMLEAVS